MANSIWTTGMTGGPISTTHKSGESVLQWVGRHNTSVENGTPGNTLTTKWPCSSGEETVTTNRNPGESDADFITRHENVYLLEMNGCPPVP
jgi:hypothetical protein